MTEKTDILVLTHGDLGKTLCETVTMFLPENGMLHNIGLHEDDNIKDLQVKMEILSKDSEQLLILTDMITAATTRIAASMLMYAKVEIVSGINLVMLITALREKENYHIEELANIVRETAREDIVNIRERLEKTDKGRKERGTCTRC